MIYRTLFYDSARLAFTFLAILLMLPAISQETRISGQKLTDARKVASDIFAKSNLPGMAVAVWHNGNIVWSEGFGFADLEAKIPVDPATSQFRIGSVSKTLTAVGLMQISEAGDIDLDAPVQRYVSAFPEKRYPVTVRQVAQHVGGIRHYRGFEFAMNVHFNSVSEGLKIFAEDTLLYKPGTKYSYSSYGWNLISAAMETASGTDFLSYMHKYVFEPAAMTYTLEDDNTKELPHRVQFYQRNGDKIAIGMQVDNSYKWAGGGFLSTAEDLASFGKHLHNGSLLSEPSLEESWTSGVLEDGTVTGYGIGWSSQKDERGRSWVGHSGGSMGGSSMFLMYPEEQLIIVVLINLSEAPARTTAFKIAEELLPK